MPMPASYLPYLPDQDFLLPHSMREWLPEGHLAYFINDTVDSLDLRRFTRAMPRAARATSRFTRP